ncbi:putative SAWADEE domain-containing protein [Helianthus annuus]|nr:putative SAWADEE domain-containing protein [Helianthus annuus]
MEIEVMEIAETEHSSEFTLAEVLEMERLYRKQGEEVKQQEFCEELAAKFSGSAIRNGKSIITWDQVHTWFLDRQLFSAVKNKSSAVDSNVVKNKLAIINSSPTALKNFVALSKARAAAEIPKKPKAQRVEETADLMFEALSAKDLAWFDVASFLTFRVMYTGELEVKVRFSGFSHDQDEWVNVRSAIRERSIPLEASECHKVKVGDLLLCYRANEDHALYSDAHVVRVERQMHDKDDCTCTFVVRFEYDNAEVELNCSEICCRPSSSL